MAAKQKIDTPKVMDISHPSKTQATPTSKPVIITNRPMIAADPMIAKAAEAALAGRVKPMANPSSEAENTFQSGDDRPATAPIITHQAKVIMPLSLQTEETKEEAEAKPKEDVERIEPVENDPMAVAEPEEAIADPGDVDATTESEVGSEADGADSKEPLPNISIGAEKKSPREPTIEIFTKEDLQKSNSVAVKVTKKTGVIQPLAEEAGNDGLDKEVETVTQEQPLATKESSKVKNRGMHGGRKSAEPRSEDAQTTDPVIMPERTLPGDDTLDSQLDADSQEDKQKTAEQKRSEDLEAIIAKGTYAVPINQVGKRRERILIGVLVIILLLAAMLNVLLDLGVVSVPWLPHTTFFAL